MKLLLLFLACVSLNFGFSQTTTARKLETSYNEYFRLPRENVFLHLNKTTFLKGEELWFTGYIQDQQRQKLSDSTTTLYCFLYNGAGKLLDKRNLFVENGVASGNFKMKPEYQAGDLYIRAFTNWMRNFENDNAFMARIELLGENDAELPTHGQHLDEITVFPEGGNFVSGALATMAFKVSKSIDYELELLKGQLIDSKGNTIINHIVINSQGFGKFTFHPLENETYRLNLELSNGRNIIKVLPSPTKYGINLSVSTMVSNKISISLNSNASQFNEFMGKKYYLAVHRDNRLVVTDVELSNPVVNLQIAKSNLLPGINIITLFDSDFKPLAERLIFNDMGVEKKILPSHTISAIKSKDFIDLNLDFFSTDMSVTYLSVSVLPADTRANSRHRSILSTFMFEPYINSFVEDPHYYFSAIDRNKLFELDLLMMIQGWSKYDWESIYDITPLMSYPYDSGVTIEGKILGEGNTTIALYPNSISGMQITEVDPQHRFIFKNAHIYKDEEVRFSLFDQNGKGKKPELSLGFGAFLVSDTKFSTAEFQKYREIFVTPSKNEMFEAQLSLSDNTTVLDSVFIKADRPKEKLTQNRMLQNGVWEGVKISPEEVSQNIFLSRLIRSLGFKVRTDVAAGTLHVSAKLPMRSAPIIFMDGYPVDEDLRDVLLQSVDEVYYEHVGTHGSSGGTIYIYQKIGSLVGDESLITFAKKLATEGFDRPKVYYQPDYSSLENQDFLDYGAVHWSGQLITGINGKTTVVFPHSHQKAFKIYVEGMNQGGRLISEVRTVSVE